MGRRTEARKQFWVLWSSKKL
uniref:Uncharacterized protein n=1 Tax=Rhizophora mucronata TaxID=61149 RepID=A0A2P2R3G4_RHIMU